MSCGSESGDGFIETVYPARVAALELSQVTPKLWEVIFVISIPTSLSSSKTQIEQVHITAISVSVQ